MAKLGRKTKYTPEVVEKILTAIKLGATYELAAHYGGIGHDTFHTWMNEKPEFSEQVFEASGTGAVQWLYKIEKAASDGDWRAAAWKLERRFPRLYGRTVVEQDIHNDGKLEVVIRYANDNTDAT